MNLNILKNGKYIKNFQVGLSLYYYQHECFTRRKVENNRVGKASGDLKHSSVVSHKFKIKCHIWVIKVA